MHGMPGSRCDLFSSLNRVVEPLVRAGVGSPGLWPVGAIVLETTGRVTGRPVSVPLLAALVGDLVLVSTVRPGSQWLRNVAANPDVRYWLLGRRRAASATVVGQEFGDPAPADAPARVRWLAAALRPWADATPASFAVLGPPRAGHARA
jgi:hypothetical protein